MSNPTDPILPPATLGIFGSGQLGRMFALAAKRMGYRVHVFSPESDTPTGQVADFETVKPYEDLRAVESFARHVSVVTIEFENLPAATLQKVESLVPVRPGSRVLFLSQHRIREKTFLREHGIATTPFASIESKNDLLRETTRLGYPSVLKTATFGYDGKGQVKIDCPAKIDEAIAAMHGREAILEAFVHFEKEVSVIVARGVDGSLADWGVIENSHENHILDLSFAPADISRNVSTLAIETARKIAVALDYVGVLCVEFFVTRDEEVLVNEIAPRPHNSGHLTFDASLTSQFEQQVRAICGLQLGDTRLLAPAAMANLLGEVWASGEPHWAVALRDPRVKLHLYGKDAARPGRKMGHLTAIATSTDEAMHAVRYARLALVGRV